MGHYLTAGLLIKIGIFTVLLELSEATQPLHLDASFKEISPQELAAQAKLADDVDCRLFWGEVLVS